MRFRGWRILFNESPGMGVQIIGRTESALVPESEAWADAASRLPKAESVPDDCLDITDDGKVIIAAPPAKESQPQTFEEWWNVYEERLLIRNITYKNLARAAWNAAKASSPAITGGESGWIEIKNGLPKYKETVLITYGGAFQETAVYMPDNPICRWRTSSGRSPNDVTYWRPLDWPLIKDVRGKE